MEKRRKPCLIVVVSEDGTAEWIPELMPRASRRELKAKEAEADAILGLSEYPFSRGAGLLNWLDRHPFVRKQTSWSNETGRVCRRRELSTLSARILNRIRINRMII
jgi:hypothetical protein